MYRFIAGKSCTIPVTLSNNLLFAPIKLQRSAFKHAAFNLEKEMASNNAGLLLLHDHSGLVKTADNRGIGFLSLIIAAISLVLKGTNY